MSDRSRAPVDHATTPRRRIATHTARVGIIGQGYVGLPLAVEFAKVGFPVTGLDTDPDCIATLASGSLPRPRRPERATSSAPSSRALSRNRKAQHSG